VRIVQDEHGYATVADLRREGVKAILAEVAHWVKVRTDKEGNPVDVGTHAPTVT
jgi:hypothetical protein